MIYFDVTKASGAGHRSGLTRVSARLLDGLGSLATPVRWKSWDRRLRPEDWFLTGELFSEAERPGFTAFLAGGPGRKAAIYHDAIPLKWPHITWPQSVARHPGYLKLLASFDRIWAVSSASRDELIAFWKWQGIAQPPPVDVLALGADFAKTPRVVSPARGEQRPPVLVSIGILEPRKNQRLLLDVAQQLWSEGLKFELHLVGRVNEHFGLPIAARVREMRRAYSGLFHHAAASDTEVRALYGRARASLFPTVAEGCGLPVIESLWEGVPCVCSDLPVLRENLAGGGCLAVAVDDRDAWTEAVRRVLSGQSLMERLRREAMARSLPTWRQASETVAVALRAA